jgi:hypothetical protein
MSLMLEEEVNTPLMLRKEVLTTSFQFANFGQLKCFRKI